MASTSSNAARTWTLAAIVISALLLVAAWFLLISPILASASEVNARTEDQNAKNDIARTQVAALREDFMRIDEYRADLASIREQITPTQRYADIQRLIAQVAEESNVTVTSLTFGTGEEIEAPTLEEPEPAEQPEAVEEDPVADEGAQTEVAPAPKPLFSGLFSIEVTIDIEGGYHDVLAAVHALQTGEQRLILINSFNFAPDDDSEGAANADATTLTISGSTFVMADPEDLALREEPVPVVDPTAPPEPLPTSFDNPFAP